MLTLEQKAAYLAKGVFGNVDEAMRLAIAERMGEREYLDGQALFMAGESGNEVYVVVSGAVEIRQNNILIAIAQPGELIGEMSVLGAGRRTAVAHAKGATTLLFLKEKALKLLIRQSPDVAFALFQVLIQRLTEANDLANFLSGNRQERGLIEVLAGDIAGQKVSIFHERSILGRSRGSLRVDAMRTALPSADPAVNERHAVVAVLNGTVFIEPLDGGVKFNGTQIVDNVLVKSSDIVEIGGLHLRFTARTGAQE